MAFPHHTVCFSVVFRDLMILRAFELGDGTGMGLNAERALTKEADLIFEYLTSKSHVSVFGTA